MVEGSGILIWVLVTCQDLKMMILTNGGAELATALCHQLKGHNRGMADDKNGEFAEDTPQLGLGQTR